MILYIAEKPSLGRAIAEVLPKPHKKGEGYITLANGDVVSWCVGHLLEQAEPDHYDPVYKSWKFEHLPIIPEQWQLKPKASTRSQLAVLRKLIKQAKTIVNAGDPDREGQLLVDEVISYLGASKTKISQAKRLLISDLNPSAVKKALSQMRMNHDYIPLATSALARSRADWLYGMNMTRAYTLQGQKVGYQGVLSVGRVQTPLLGLVVRRDDEIAKFVSKPFYEVLAHVETEAKQGFSAKWQPSAACEPYMDSDGRVIYRKLADNVAARITGQPALVKQVNKQAKKQNAPLPYSLSALQIDAAKRFGMSAKQVLDTCQSLYEKHKLITYPRSDSRYLPKDQFSDAPKVITAILNNAADLTKDADAPNASLKSKAWNDSKVDAHHAIIPTAKQSQLASLSSYESQLYKHIARQYLAQFYPAYEYDETEVELEIAGGLFTCKAKTEKKLGWKQLYSRTDNKATASEENEELAKLPPLKVGQILACLRGEVLEKMTQPPKHFTDATLLGAMTGIGRFVTDAEIKKTLKETDGIGTEATRAGIIELLFKRNFLTRVGKQIHATEAGKGLIYSLPEKATTPDMTALWENQLAKISDKQMNYQQFMQPLTQMLTGLIEHASQTIPTALQGLKSMPTKSRFKRKTSSTKRVTSAKRSPKTSSRKKAP
ncbi:DNA topoisomerase III [Shewanella marina]|uniref:DNA topoisomerase III n=1 Tax=Shewanella marina TaxID=487319 RepID=UPI000470C9E2|nr:DNA topoisomerase III [Shewanella marina]